MTTPTKSSPSAYIAVIFLLIVFAALLFLPLSGCSGGGGGGDDPALTIKAKPVANGMAACATEDGEAVCPKGAQLKLTLAMTDGSSVAGKASWSADSDAVSVDGSGTKADAAAEQDWFDLGDAEGDAVITAESGDASARLPVTVVVDASGVWHCTADAGFKADLTLRQEGRTVTDPNTGYSGSVENDRLTLNVSSLQVSATLTSRTEAAGTFAGPNGLSGNVSCTR